MFRKRFRQLFQSNSIRTPVVTELFTLRFRLMAIIRTELSISFMIFLAASKVWRTYHVQPLFSKFFSGDDFSGVWKTAKQIVQKQAVVIFLACSQLYCKMSVTRHFLCVNAASSVCLLSSEHLLFISRYTIRIDASLDMNSKAANVFQC